MSPGSSTESYPAFARIGLRENPGKNLNHVTCPDRDSNPGHLVSQPDALTVTPQTFEMGRACSTYGRIQKCIFRVLVGRPAGKRPLGRPRRRWEDNIEMDLREVGYDDREWINLSQDRDQWRAYVRAAMNLRVPEKPYTPYLETVLLETSQDTTRLSTTGVLPYAVEDARASSKRSTSD
ncbi:hypothetical protein ANN_20460 [Periplaneta americana]|uniref:Uncharacterized protein n=1 Tax=Periplaneta americana TaxID=6978 RepID=A0ABQ8SDC1_PERAM|nr:hypothetical protein ANN_20460 [Periplaneta americana]